MLTQTARVRFVAGVLDEALDRIDRGLAPWEAVANGVSEHLGVTAVCFAKGDKQNPEMWAWPDSIRTDVLLEATAREPRGHPIVDFWLSGHRQVVSVSGLVGSSSRWRRSEAFAVMRREVGCTESAGMRIDDGRGPLQALGFARPREYRADDLQALAMLEAPMVTLRRLYERRALQRAPCPRGQAIPRRPEIEVLSSRELQVLCALAEGVIATRIARDLCISPRTVHHHLGRIYAKLGAHDRLGAVLAAQRQGLLGPR